MWVSSTVYNKENKSMEKEKIEIILKAKTNQKFLYVAILGIPIGMIIKGTLGSIIFWIGIVFLVVYILNLLILRKEMTEVDEK